MKCRLFLTSLLLASAPRAQQFVQHPVSSSAGAPNAVVAADLDGDGDRDLLMSAFPGPAFFGEIGWFANEDGLASFGPEQLIDTNLLGISTLSASDLNGDGATDVLAVTGSAFSGSATMAWYENEDGLGDFGSAQLISNSSEEPRAASIADVDGDGDPDVLVVGTPFPTDTIGWYANDGSGDFGPEQLIASSSGARSIAGADLDGDGDLDALAAFLGSGGRTVWYENEDGQGSFGPEQLIASSPSTAVPDAAVATAADLDGDGDQDVLSGGVGRLAWHANLDGQGSFGPAQAILDDPSTSTFAIFATDLSEDGAKDVLIEAASAGFDGKLAWFESADGLGTFGPEQIVVAPASFDTFRVFPEDLDGDGDLDLVTGSTASDLLAWLENDVCCALSADVATLSLVAGGTQELTLDAGPEKALGLYLLQTTTTGTSPGLSIEPAPFKLPLNFSGLLLFTIVSPNVLIPNSLGILDASGKQTALLTLPPGLDAALAGVALHHAYVVLDLFQGLVPTGVSKPASLRLTP